MPQYKLTYLNLCGAAEPIRWVLKIAGLEFEDVRIEQEDWLGGAKTSGKFPLGQVPMLEMDGKEYTQSTAILRYLAKKHGLVAGDDLLNLTVDIAHHIVVDGWSETVKWFRETDPERQAKQKEFLLETWYPQAGKQLTKILDENPGDFIAGSKLTYADLTLANWFAIWTTLVDPDLPTKHPKIAKHQKAVHEVPQIKAWIAVRPKTLI